jgi:hypothetical protein
MPKHLPLHSYGVQHACRQSNSPHLSGCWCMSESRPPVLSRAVKGVLGLPFGLFV